MLNILNHFSKKKKKKVKTSNSENFTVLLLTDDHIIKPFDCEDEDLNDFLFNEAILYQKQMLATTFIVENSERTLGFYSLLNDTMQIKEELFPSKSQYKKFVGGLLPHLKRHLKSIPSLKIGRLGVDKSYKGKGLGSMILQNIISDCIAFNKNQACRLITVDAYQQAFPFYERFGFQYISKNDENEEVRQMFLDLMTISND